MNNIIKFISDNESVVMIALFIMIIILAIAVFITDYISKKKSKKIREGLIEEYTSNESDASNSNEESNYINSSDSNLPNSNSTNNIDIVQQNEVYIPSKSDSNDQIEIKYVDEDSELEKTRAQIELKNLKEELIKADRLEKEKQRELEKTKELEIIDESIISKQNPVDEFEKKQEEDAIISIDQFNKVSDKIYEQNESIQYKDEGNEPISIAELEKLYNSAKEEIREPIVKQSADPIDIATEVKKEESIKINDEFKFKKSPIISPVYGINSNSEEIKKISLENTANLDKLSEEIKKTNEFLNTLKELRKNLQ